MMNLTRKLHHGKPLCSSDSGIRGLKTGSSTVSKQRQVRILNEFSGFFPNLTPVC